LRQAYVDLFSRFTSLRSSDRKPYNYNNRFPKNVIDTEITSEVTIPDDYESSLSDFAPFSISDSLSRSEWQRPKLGARVVAWIVRLLTHRFTRSVDGLNIRVSSGSTLDILRGKVDGVELTFDKISIAQILVSGGGRVVVDRVRLRLLPLLFRDNRETLAKPYRICGDFLLTQTDIINSRNIRKLLQLLVNTVMEKVLAQRFLSLKVTKVSIRQRRLFAQGEIDMNLGGGEGNTNNLMTFEISTSAGVSEGGQVVYLTNIEVVLNPYSGSRTRFPIILNEPIGIDIGTECKIESLVIGNTNIWLRLVARIFPTSKLQDYIKTDDQEVKRALYKYDLANFLSKLLRIPGGLVTRWGLGLFRR
jgi:hypothetical protein